MHATNQDGPARPRLSVCNNESAAVGTVRASTLRTIKMVRKTSITLIFGAQTHFNDYVKQLSSMF
jgi:hypothetical protein